MAVNDARGMSECWSECERVGCSSWAWNWMNVFLKMGRERRYFCKLNLFWHYLCNIYKNIYIHKKSPNKREYLFKKKSREYAQSEKKIPSRRWRFHRFSSMKSSESVYFSWFVLVFLNNTHHQIRSKILDILDFQEFDLVIN